MVQNDSLGRAIVIGTSAGGLAAISALISAFRQEQNIAIFVVMHLSKNSNSKVISSLLQKKTGLVCKVAAEGMPVEKGHLYLAPEDHHMLVDSGKLRISHGAHENKYRPSIDSLFRSAAVYYRNKTIGIILTGMLDDGTAGMAFIREAGGICIIQDPAEASFPDMPTSVKLNEIAHFQASLKEMPAVLEKILNSELPPLIPLREELAAEAAISKNMMTSTAQLNEIAAKSDFSCPDCGGRLWEINDSSGTRYRCHTGHTYTEGLLAKLQDEKIEESIWVSIRMMEEKANLMLLLSDKATENGERRKTFEDRWAETRKHIDRLKSLLFAITEHQFEKKILNNEQE